MLPTLYDGAEVVLKPVFRTFADVSEPDRSCWAGWSPFPPPPAARGATRGR
ncbi:hypothetical protein ACWDSL_36945 [Streptomyces sp. NPDC000941]